MLRQISCLGVFILFTINTTALFGGDEGCPSEGEANIGDNVVDTTTSTTTIDLTDHCIPGDYGSIYHNAISYAFTPPEDGDYLFSTCSLVDFDTKLGLLAGTGCDPSTAIACNEDTSGCSYYSTDLRVTDLVAGNPYVILVGGYTESSAGTGLLRISLDLPDGFGMALEATVLPTPTSPGADFGEQLCLDGNQLLVGAPYASEQPDTSGAIYFHENDESGSWVQTARFEIEPDQAFSYQYFGRYGLTIDEKQSVATAGAPYAGSSGELRVYERLAGAGWSETEVLTHPMPRKEQVSGFGWACAGSGDLIAVGDTWGSGSVVLFRRDNGTYAPELILDGEAIAKELGFDTFESFGDRVTLEDDVLVVAAPYAPGIYGRQGMTFIYEQLDEKNPSSWTRTMIVEGTTNRSQHGRDIELVQGRLFISEPFSDTTWVESGQIRIFERIKPGTWTEAAPILPIDPDQTGFGTDFSAEYNRVAIGNRLYHQNAIGDWLPVAWQELKDSGGTTQVTTCSLDGDRLAVGADNADLDGYNTGAVYVLNPDAHTDCDGDGVDDDDAILSGQSTDCDGDGRPDLCQFGIEVAQQLELVTPGGDLQIAEFDELLPPGNGLLIEIAVIGDLDSSTEFLALSLDGAPEAILFAENGAACPSLPQIHQIQVSSERSRQLLEDGYLEISIASSGTVDPDECSEGHLSVSINYIGMPHMPDCDGDGIPDWCALVRGAQDCNANAIPDFCDIASGELYDCDDDGVADECGELPVPDSDCDGDGLSDRCTFGAYAPSAEIAEANIFYYGPDDTIDMLSVIRIENDPDRPVVDRFVVDTSEFFDSGMYQEHIGRPITLAIWRDDPSSFGPYAMELHWSEVRSIPDTAPMLFDIGPIDVSELGDNFWFGMLYTQLPDDTVQNITPISFSTDNIGPERCWVSGGPGGTMAVDDVSTPDYPWTYLGTYAQWSLSLRLLPVGEVDGDCDRNGRYDACQIAADPAGDKDGNGQPDACQFARGDLDLNGVVDGGDLTILLSLWGFLDPPVGDLNLDGIVDGIDLSMLLSEWN